MPYRRTTKRPARKTRRVARGNRKVYNRATIKTSIPRPMGRKGPFPIRMNTQLVYKNPSTTIVSSGVTNFNYCQFALNSMFDLDQTNVIGNKQPLFYDQLLSITGPYRNYKVNAWKTTIRLINLSDKAMYVYYDPCAALLTEADSALEMENRRGVQSFTLTAQNNAKPMCTIKKFQTLKSFFPNSINSSENFSAAYNTGPSTVAYATLGWKPIDNSTTPFTVAIQYQTIFYCTLYNADSVDS